MTGNSTRRAGERGSSAVEFSLVVAAMAALIVAVVMGAGQMVGQMFDDGCGRFAAQVGGSDCAEDGTSDDTTAQEQSPDQSIGPDDPWVNRYGDVSSGV